MKKLFVLALLFVCAGALYAADTDYFSTGPNEEFRVMSSGIIFSTAGFAAQDFWQDVPSISSVCVRNDVAAREISNVHWLWLVGYYVLLIGLLVWHRKRKSRQVFLPT